MLHFALLAIFPALMIAAALSDATSFTIPNWMTGALAVLFLPVALSQGMAWADIGICFAIGLGVLVVGMGLFLPGWIGGGDAKLLAAAALWLGWPAGFTFILVTALAGGALAVALTAARGSNLAGYAANGPVWVGKLLDPKAGAPYGLAIAAGALFAYPASVLVAGLQRGF